MSFSEVFGPIKWHILACVAVFYVFPALQYVTATEYIALLLTAISYANTAVITITSIVLTIKEGFKWYYAFVVLVLYVPSIMIYYDFTMPILVNAFSYFALTYVSQIIGVIVGKIIERNR